MFVPSYKIECFVRPSSRGPGIAVAGVPERLYQYWPWSEAFDRGLRSYDHPVPTLSNLPRFRYGVRDIVQESL